MRVAGEIEIAKSVLIGRRGLAVAAVLAAGTALARHADGSLMLPGWAAACLQMPALLGWVWLRCIRGRDDGGIGLGAERLLTAAIILAAAAIASARSSLDPFFIATTVFVSGSLAVEQLSSLYRRTDDQIATPRKVIKTLAPPWLLTIAACTVLLAIPLATDSGVPDYRYNFMSHLLDSAFAAAGAASLVGLTVYHPGEDYSVFGQVVLVVQTQLAGMGFAAIGLSIVRPFLSNPVRLRTVLAAAWGLQVAAVAATAGAWNATDAPETSARIWFSVVHVTSAIWNSGLTLKADGLSGELASGPIFVTFCTLALIGSLGLPIIIDILIGRRDAPDAKGQSRPTARSIWTRLPQREAAAAFALLILGAIALWCFEMPGWLPESWSPERPIELGDDRLAIRDDPSPGARWSKAAFMSATLRSAGLQSVSIVEGALAWPSVVVFLLWMIVGGSAGGTGGGLRVTAFILLFLNRTARRERRSRMHSHPSGVAPMLIRLFAVWVVLNVAAVLLLALSTEADAYEAVFDGVAALNGVGLSTGLIVHLTPLGTLTMILLMVGGRIVPLLFWCRISETIVAMSRSGALRDGAVA